MRSCNFCLLTRKLGMRLGVPILSPNPKVLSFRTGGVGPEESVVLWSGNGACADLLRVHGEEEPLACSRCLATGGQQIPPVSLRLRVGMTRSGVGSNG